jgi:hypothetical protein
MPDPQRSKEHRSEVVYISIGNSDDKLTQAQWHQYWRAVNFALPRATKTIISKWVSPSTEPYQNACWAVVLMNDELQVNRLKKHLSRIASDFNQDSIAWAVCPQTEFIPGLMETKEEEPAS